MLFNHVFSFVLCFMYVLFFLRLGTEFSRLMAHYKCIIKIVCITNAYYFYYIIIIITYQPETSVALKR